MGLTLSPILRAHPRSDYNLRGWARFRSRQPGPTDLSFHFLQFRLRSDYDRSLLVVARVTFIRPQRNSDVPSFGSRLIELYHRRQSSVKRISDNRRQHTEESRQTGLKSFSTHRRSLANELTTLQQPYKRTQLSFHKDAQSL
jgi:hypothetical protein